MNLLGRATRPDDLDQCTHLLRDRFLYEEARLGELRAMWLEIITRDVGRSAVVFNSGDPQRILGFGVSAAVDCARYEAIVANRAPFVGKTLLDDWSSGKKPFLDESAFAEANAKGGLHFVVIHNGVSDTIDMAHFPAALSAMSENFVAHHMGCNMKAIVHESFGVPRDFARDLGMVITEYLPEYRSRLDAVPQDLTPTIVSMSRDQAQEHPGNLMMYQMFLRFTAPRCGLRATERRLLRLALEGASDEGIAHVFGIAPRTLKKRWADIYSAMEPVTGVFSGMGNGQRGAEIRRHVLRYVREHPEELHAYASVST